MNPGAGAASNRRWTRAETVIALDVYIRNRDSLPTSADHAVVCELSETLRALASKRGDDIDEKFRNLAGCFMKLRQFQNLDSPPKGLKKHSKTDREIFNRYAKDAIGRQLAVTSAKNGVGLPDETPPTGLPAGYSAARLAETNANVLKTALEPEVRGDVIVQPGVKPIGQLFKNETRLAVPRYQRAFSWQEDQVVDLCQDIRKLTLRFTEGDDRAQHFFGGFVMTQNPQGLGGWDIIDGQQRITTFLLCLHKLVDAYKLLSERARLGGDSATETAAATAAHDIRENFVWTVEADALTGEKKRRTRLVAPLEDEEFFMALLDGSSPPAVRSSQQLLSEACETIWRELYAPIFVDAKAADSDRLRALLTIQTAMLSGSIVVQLSARDTGAAYRLFMVLNDRGMQLSEGDLLRAETLERLARHKNEFDRAAIAWDTILGFDTDVVKSFLRTFFPSVVGRRADIRDLVDEYRIFYLYRDVGLGTLTTENAVTVVKRIEQMSEEIAVFEALTSDQWPFSTEEVSSAERLRLSRLLRILRHELCLPLLLAATRVMAQREFVSLVFTVERFAFRYKNVCNGHADAAAKQYYVTAQELRHGGRKRSIIDRLVSELKKLVDADADDGTFRLRLVKQLRYNRTGQRNNIKWLLAAMEDCHSWLHEEPDKRAKYPVLDKAFTLNLEAAQIDHIYPQTPKSRDVDAALEPVKHEIGNLTLLEGRHNKISNNTPFASKRTIYREINKVQATKRLARNRTWTKRKAEDRQSRLIEAALELCVL